MSRLSALSTVLVSALLGAASANAQTSLLSTTSLRFPDTPVGSVSAPQTISFSSFGGLTATGATLNGVHQNDFQLVSTTCNFPITAGQSCSGTFVFTPQGGGERFATLTIPFQPGAVFPNVTALFSGRGTNAPSTAPLTLSSSTLDFGAVPVGSKSPKQTVTLTNPGDVTLSNVASGFTNGVHYTGQTNPEFQIETDCVTTLAPHASCRLVFTFTPTAFLAAPQTLFSISTDAQPGAQTVSLNGIGGSLPTVAPTITPGSNTFTANPTVTITTPTPNANIYYTIDGSTPFYDGPTQFITGKLYTGPFTVFSSETINAITVSGTVSSVSSATFVVNVGAGTISTYAGNGDRGFSGDGSAATSATFDSPEGIAVDKSGNLYVADCTFNGLNESTGRVRKVDTNGVITTIAGGGTLQGAAAEGQPATAVRIFPDHVAVDPNGNVYVEEGDIFKITPAGIITTFAEGQGSALGDGGPASNASFLASDIAADINGNIYFSDTQNNRIRKITPDGIIHTVAGGGGSRFPDIPAPNNVQATTANLSTPAAIAVDQSGNIYFSTSDYPVAVYKVNSTGLLTIVAQAYGFSGDGGPATAALVGGSLPGLAVDASGSLYIADLSNKRVRRITPDGIINTVAGTGTAGISGDGGPATAGDLTQPVSVAVDSKGSLYILDRGGSILVPGQGARVRKVTF